MSHKKITFRGAKVAFVLFRNKELVDVTQIETTQAAEIERRLQSIAEDGYTSVKAIYDGGGVFNISFPKTDKAIESTAKRLFRNL